MKSLQISVHKIMAYLRASQQYVSLLALLVMAITLVIWWRVDVWYRQHLLDNQRLQSKAQLAPYKNALSTAVNRRLTLLAGLSAFAHAKIQAGQPVSPAEFELFSAQVYTTANGIRHFAIIARDTPRLIYPPPDGGVFSMGDFSQDLPATSRDRIQHALETDQMILSGPFQLRQGGLGLVARQVIYRNGERWGLAVIALEVGPLLAEAGLDSMSTDLQMALRDGNRQIFYGEAATWRSDPVTVDIELPGETWELAGVPADGWEAAIHHSLIWSRRIEALVVALFVGLGYIITRHETHLLQTVETRTKALSAIAQALQQQIGVHRQTEAALREREGRLEQRVKELDALHRASAQLQQLYTPEELAQTIIEILAKVVQFDCGAIFLIDQATGLLRPFALKEPGQDAETGTFDKEDLLAYGLRIGYGVTGWVAQTGQSARIGDIRDDTRYVSIRESFGSELCVPMWAEKKVIGVVNIESARLNAYSEEDQRLLETIATQIALAIQQSYLYQQILTGREQLGHLTHAIVSAQEDERQRIARELHDEAGQGLTALKIVLELLKVDLPESLSCHIDDAIELTTSTMEQIRLLAHDLRPPALDTLGLSLALGSYCQEFHRRTHIMTRYTGDTTLPPLNDMVNITLYRLLQEALTNVARHARATCVEVRLSSEAGVLRLAIEDDGVGFNVGQVHLTAGKLKGIGLMGMQERAKLLGGYLEISSQPNQGTRLVVGIPIPQVEVEHQ